jgi:hypothetical protein
LVFVLSEISFVSLFELQETANVIKQEKRKMFDKVSCIECVIFIKLECF